MKPEFDEFSGGDEVGFERFFNKVRHSLFRCHLREKHKSAVKFKILCRGTRKNKNLPRRHKKSFWAKHFIESLTLEHFNISVIFLKNVKLFCHSTQKALQNLTEADIFFISDKNFFWERDANSVSSSVTSSVTCNSFVVAFKQQLCM
jgi:hypothetical protein